MSDFMALFDTCFAPTFSSVLFLKEKGQTYPKNKIEGEDMS